MKETDKKTSAGPHKCDQCEATFETRQKLGSHRFSKHGTRVRPAPEVKQEGQAEVPQKRTYSRTPKHEPMPVQFCPCCGLNLVVLAKAIELASKMKGAI